MGRWKAKKKMRGRLTYQVLCKNCRKVTKHFLIGRCVICDLSIGDEK